jgi:hypothetical protein
MAITGNFEKNYQQNIYEQYLKNAQGLNRDNKFGQGVEVGEKGANSVTFNPFAPVGGSHGVSGTENIGAKQGLVARLDKIDPPPVDTRSETDGQKLYLYA